MTLAQVQSASDTTIIGSDTTVMRRLDTQGPVKDFESVAKEHDPTRAALLSAAIPGLGQA